MEVGLLGPLVVRVDAATVAIRRGRARVLLTRLALDAGAVVGVDALVDDVFDDTVPAHPSNALQLLVSNLRRSLGSDAVVRSGRGYGLAATRADVDALRFEEAVRTVRAGAGGEPEAQVRVLDEALGLWRGAALLDAAGHRFASVAAVRLDETRLEALELRADLMLRLGRHAHVVADLAALARHHPTRTRLHELVAVALYRSGRHADALAALTSARRMLVEQHGLEPSASLAHLEVAILRQDASLDAADAPRPLRPLRAAADPIRPPPELVGRRDDLRAVHGLAMPGSVVTIVGAPGVGKSALAAALVSGQAAVTVDLAPLDDDGAGAAVTEAIGRLAPLDRPWLHLDGCEHVVTPVRRVLDAMRPQLDGVCVVCTSRRPMLIGGERVHRLRPLAVPPADASLAETSRSPAVELFVRRARESDSSFELDETNARAVAAICRGVDGLPLALELAAARCDVVSVVAIEARLERSWAAADSEGTLEAAIDWSCRMVDADGGAALRSLATIACRMPLDAALAVIGGAESQALRSLEQLVRHSLVERDAAYRYHLLGPVRSVVGAAVPAGERDAALDRLVAWVDAWASGQAERLWTDRHHDALDETRAEHALVVTALDRAFAGGDRLAGARIVARVGRAWGVLGTFAGAGDDRGASSERVRQVAGWLRHAESSGPLAPDEEALLAVVAGIAARVDGAPGEAERRLERARVLAARAGDLGLRAQVGIELASLRRHQGDRAGAAAALAPVLASASEGDGRYRWILAVARGLAAVVDASRSELAAAEGHLRTLELDVDARRDPTVAILRAMADVELAFAQDDGVGVVAAAQAGRRRAREAGYVSSAAAFAVAELRGAALTGDRERVLDAAGRAIEDVQRTGWAALVLDAVGAVVAAAPVVGLGADDAAAVESELATLRDASTVRPEAGRRADAVRLASRVAELITATRAAR